MLEKILNHLKDLGEEHNSGIKSILYYYYYIKLGWCGCGDVSAALTAIKKYLYSISDSESRDERLKEEFDVDTIFDNNLLLCLAYALDAAEFTEHGISIGRAWLTQDGEYFLWALQHATEKDLNEL